MNNDVERLLPHRTPMVMIDRLLACDGDTAAAVKTFTPGDYGTDGDRVLEPALIECLAQTMAAKQGFQARESKQPVESGMLVAVSGFVFHRPAQCGREITLVVELTKDLSPLLMVSGCVMQDGAVIAEGSLAFHVGGR